MMTSGKCPNCGVNIMYVVLPPNCPSCRAPFTLRHGPAVVYNSGSQQGHVAEVKHDMGTMRESNKPELDPLFATVWECERQWREDDRRELRHRIEG